MFYYPLEFREGFFGNFHSLKLVEKMANILITGGTGMVGMRLTEMLLAKGYEVSILSRNNQSSTVHRPRSTVYTWDISTAYIDAEAIQKADYIIHLAGAGVADKRWTSKRKKEITNSRTQSGDLLVKALTAIPNKVQAVISASAIGWYGPDKKNNPKKFMETDPAYSDFLGETCLLWEKSIQPVKELGKRLVQLRMGIVLSNQGGALREFKKPLQFHTAAILGTGKQMISWVHMDDICNQFIFALEQENLQGIFNAVAPNPVSNKRLTLLLAEKICGAFYLPIYIPRLLLKIMLGEMSIEVLKSTTVSSKKIEDAGFIFNYPTIDEALTALSNN